MPSSALCVAFPSHRQRSCRGVSKTAIEFAHRAVFALKFPIASDSRGMTWSGPDRSRRGRRRAGPNGLRSGGAPRARSAGTAIDTIARESWGMLSPRLTILLRSEHAGAIAADHTDAGGATEVCRPARLARLMMTRGERTGRPVNQSRMGRL